MGTKYNHLTEQDRIFLSRMLDMHYPKNKIAKILSVHRTTICREIKRNSNALRYSNKTHYSGSSANNKYMARRQKKSKIEKDLSLAKYVLPN